MGFWAGLFGSSKNVETAVELAADSVRGVGTWIDEQAFTDEEKSKAFFRAAEMQMEFIQKAQDENSIRSITRRIMAWAVMGTFLLFLISGAALYEYNPEYSQFLLRTATESMLGELTLGVSVFYFGVHLMRALKQ